MPPAPLARAPLAAAAAGTLACALALAPRAARAESPPVSIVQNDSYGGGGQAGFAAGLAAGDIAAARFATAAGGTLIAIEAVYGGGAGGTAPETLLLHAWADDGAGGAEPGALLMTAPVELLPDGELHYVSVAYANLPAGFRLGLELIADAPPTLGHDLDGASAAGRNFARRAGAWEAASAAGVPGDWILRAVVMDPLDPGDGNGDGSGADAGVDAGGARPGRGSGCQASGGGASLAAPLAAGLLALARRQRRRRAR